LNKKATENTEHTEEHGIFPCPPCPSVCSVGSVNTTSRFIALGASNLTRGFGTIVSIARAAWGPEVQILAAHGRGRSYGVHSRLLFRTLPGILESGLWQKLESLPPIPTRALVADVGNDILYGYSSTQILDWVEEVIRRLQSVTRDITITDLPTFNIRQLSNAKFLAVRSILYTGCRLAIAQVIERIEKVSAGLAEISAARSIRFIRMNPEWYGMDPVHIQFSSYRIAWPEILGLSPGVSGGSLGLTELLKVHSLAPERRWLFGVEQFTPQPGLSLPSGGRVWLY
jgi:hypothetical protein